MKTNVQKTIMQLQIKSFQFLRTFNWRLKREVVTGIIWLENDKRVRVEGSNFYIMNNEGVNESIVLKSNPAYKRIKRLIARWFSTYRKGPKGGLGHHVTYWRSRAIDGLHNVELFKISGISFKENKNNFLRLAS